MRSRERQEECAAGLYDNQMIEIESSVYRCITNSSRQQIAVWNIGLYGDGGGETHFPQKTENVSPGVMSRSQYFSSNSLRSRPGHCVDFSWQQHRFYAGNVAALSLWLISLFIAIKVVDLLYLMWMTH